jgi:hypothetical protein
MDKTAKDKSVVRRQVPSLRAIRNEVVGRDGLEEAGNPSFAARYLSLRDREEKGCPDNDQARGKSSAEIPRAADTGNGVGATTASYTSTICKIIRPC